MAQRVHAQLLVPVCLFASLCTILLPNAQCCATLVASHTMAATSCHQGSGTACSLVFHSCGYFSNVTHMLPLVPILVLRPAHSLRYFLPQSMCALCLHCSAVADACTATQHSHPFVVSGASDTAQACCLLTDGGLWCVPVIVPCRFVAWLAVGTAAAVTRPSRPALCPASSRCLQFTTSSGGVCLCVLTLVYRYTAGKTTCQTTNNEGCRHYLARVLV